MLLKKFTDIDLTFQPHPSTGDLKIKRDEQAIKNAVKNLILTRHFERPFHSEIGSSVNSLLFDIPSFSMNVLLKKEIENTILNFEPRVDILNIDVLLSHDNNTANVTIVFQVKNTLTPITLQFPLDRTR